MDSIHITNLRVFLLALYQFPTIPPELQSALQNLPSDLTEMMLAIYKLVEQEPLATKYKECGKLLEARVGVRSKGDQPTTSSDPSPNDEPAQDFETIIEAIENQTLAGMKAIVEKIIQNLHQIPRDTIQPLLESPTHV